MRHKIFIILTLLSCATLLGQTAVTKKKTKITYDYSNLNFGGHVSVDTTITLFDKNGQAILENGRKPNYTFINITKTVTVDSTKQKLVKKYFRSDSTVQILTRYNYKDSTLYYLLQDNDTLEIWKTFLKHKKVIATTRQSFRDELYSYNDRIKVNFFRKKRTEKTVYEDNSVEIKRFIVNKIFNTQKEFNYNKTTKRWFLKTKEKFSRNGQLMRETDQFYHDFHKRYFKTFIKYKYNSHGQIILTLTKDHYRTIESKTIYLYDYY